MQGTLCFNLSIRIKLFRAFSYLLPFPIVAPFVEVLLRIDCHLVSGDQPDPLFQSPLFMLMTYCFHSDLCLPSLPLASHRICFIQLRFFRSTLSSVNVSAQVNTHLWGLSALCPRPIVIPPNSTPSPRSNCNFQPFPVPALAS